MISLGYELTLTSEEASSAQGPSSPTLSQQVMSTNCSTHVQCPLYPTLVCRSYDRIVMHQWLRYTKLPTAGLPSLRSLCGPVPGLELGLACGVRVGLTRRPLRHSASWDMEVVSERAGGRGAASRQTEARRVSLDSAHAPFTHPYYQILVVSTIIVIQ
uniref:SFRICE_016873 n=1 Tax=Spodoptera frugiperda TaxID=7108 RepID=A0A2H1VQ02_SPOFR